MFLILIKIKMSPFYKTLIITLLIWGYSCNPKEKTPPKIPSDKITNFDFSFFEQNSIEGSNYDFTATKVLEWKDLLTDSLSLYRMFLYSTKSHEFQFQKDNTWLIDYSFIFKDENYDAKLIGIIEQDTVFYKGFLSYLKENDTNTDMLFLNGKVFDDYKTEEWKFNKPVIIDTIPTLVQFIEINLGRDSLSMPFIKFTNKTAGENNLNYISANDIENSDFNKFTDIYHKGTDIHTIAEWSSSLKTGKVKNSLHYNDENWHCWDENLSDIFCVKK